MQIHILDSILSPQAQKTGCHGLPKAYFAALKAEAGLVGVTRDHLAHQSFQFWRCYWLIRKTTPIGVSSDVLCGAFSASQDASVAAMARKRRKTYLAL